MPPPWKPAGPCHGDRCHAVLAPSRYRKGPYCKPCQVARGRWGRTRDTQRRARPVEQCQGDGCGTTLPASSTRQGPYCKPCVAKLDRVKAKRSASLKAYCAQPGVREKRIQAAREGRLGWCPVAYRPLYQSLKATGMRAAERRRVVLDQVERDKATWRATGRLPKPLT